jgi:hypothetical protein
MDNLYGNTKTIYNHLESIKKDNILYRFKQEQKHCSNDDRLIIIENILKQFEHKKEDKKISIQKFHERIDKINEMGYYKTWGTLNPFQKENRLLKYIDITYKDNDEMKELLLTLLKNDKLHKYIVYNSETAEITNIDLEKK